jgi:hypothetical protein
MYVPLFLMVQIPSINQRDKNGANFRWPEIVFHAGMLPEMPRDIGAPSFTSLTTRFNGSLLIFKSNKLPIVQ